MSKTINEVLEPFKDEKQTYTITRYIVDVGKVESLFTHWTKEEALKEIEEHKKNWKDIRPDEEFPEAKIREVTTELDFTNKYNVGDLVHNGNLERAVITRVDLNYQETEYLYALDSYTDWIAWTEDELEPYFTVEQEYEKLGYTREEYEEEEKDYLSYKVVKFTRLEGTVLATVVFTRAYDNKTSRVNKTVKSYLDYYDPDHKLPISLNEEELTLQIRALNELEYFQPKGITKYNIISQGIKVYETLDKEEAEKMVEKNNREVGEFNQKQADNGDETVDNYFYISEEII